MRWPRPACDHAGTMHRDLERNVHECTRCGHRWELIEGRFRLSKVVDPIDEVAS